MLLAEERSGPQLPATVLYGAVALPLRAQLLSHARGALKLPWSRQELRTPLSVQMYEAAPTANLYCVMSCCPLSLPKDGFTLSSRSILGV